MKHAISLALVLAPAVLLGCGDVGPRLVKVSGTVTLNGKPYAGALIEFMPDRANPVATLGTDTTGPSGNYLIHSASGRNGLSPGKYTVSVSKAPAGASSAPGSGDQAPTPENDPGQKLAESSAGSRKTPAAKDVGASGTFSGEVTTSATVLDFDVKGPANGSAK